MLMFNSAVYYSM